MLNIITKWKAARASKRLAATLRPDPEYRVRRMAQFNKERRDRIAKNLSKGGLA